MEDKTIRKIQERLTRLEKAVFTKRAKVVTEVAVDDFAGLKGGIQLLVSRAYFKAKKPLSEIRNELESHGYHYSAAAIQTTLNRLSTRGGLLATFREGGKKVYVKRR